MLQSLQICHCRLTQAVTGCHDSCDSWQLLQREEEAGGTEGGLDHVLWKQSRWWEMSSSWLQQCLQSLQWSDAGAVQYCNAFLWPKMSSLNNPKCQCRPVVIKKHLQMSSLHLDEPWCFKENIQNQNIYFACKLSVLTKIFLWLLWYWQLTGGGRYVWTYVRIDTRHSAIICQHLTPKQWHYYTIHWHGSTLVAHQGELSLKGHWSSLTRGC